jgi:hypothetical protein
MTWNWFDRWLARNFGQPLEGETPPNAAIATEKLPDTSNCSVLYNINPATTGPLPRFSAVDLLVEVLSIPLAPIAIPLMALFGEKVKARARARARAHAERPLPKYIDIIRGLRDSTWEKNGIREKDHIYIGNIRGTQVPAPAHESHYMHNMEVAGPIGSGKDYRVINPVANQALARGKTVIKINHKKDDTDPKMFGLMAHVNGVRFKLFTLDATKPTHMLNFLEQSHRKFVDRMAWLQIFVKAMGLNQTTLSSGTFHADKAFQAIAPVFLNYDPLTFQDMLDILHDPNYATRFNLQDYDFKYANHLFAKLMQPAANIPLNLTKATAPPGVYENRIDLVSALKHPEAIYLDLRADSNSVLAQLISDMFVQQINAAADVVPENERVDVLLIVSDAARAAGPILDDAVRHLRSKRISICIGHHTVSDLGDWSESIVQNCRLRVVFGGADPKLVKQMEAVSGKVKRRVPSFDNELETSSYREVEMPRIGAEEILEISMQPGVAIMDARPHRGLAAYRHPIFVEVPFPVPRETFDFIAAGPWPERPGMFIAKDYRPPEDPPQEPPPPPKQPSPETCKMFDAWDQQ